MIKLELSAGFEILDGEGARVTSDGAYDLPEYITPDTIDEVVDWMKRVKRRGGSWRNLNPAEWNTTAFRDPEFPALKAHPKHAAVWFLGYRGRRSSIDTVTAILERALR